MPENSKKFLWLAAAVSLFALIVIAAAFFLFAPGKSAEQAPFDLSGKAESRQESPEDFVADTPLAPSTTQTTSAGDIIIVYGNDPSAPAALPPADAKPASTTIYVSPPATQTTIKPAEQPKASTAPAQPAVQAPPPKPAATVAKATTTTVAKATTTTKAPAKTTAAVQPAAGDYWIQAGSFSVKDNADALKAAFINKSLPAVITVRDIDGKSRYIVKVGPYPSRTDAGKWLSAAKSVKGAEQAWITQ